MNQRNLYPLWLFTLLLAAFLVACGSEPAEVDTAPAAEEETTTTEETDTATETTAEDTAEMEEAEPADSGDRTVVRWFVGLGTGQNAEQVEAQEAVVDAFNASQDEIELQMEIVQNDVAYDTLATLIASGDAPDIVGPVGVRGSNAFSGQWADLEPLAESAGYDLGQFPQAAVDFYRVAGEGLIGLPFAVFPSHIYFNKDLFDEAGLPYPPQEYGQLYGEGTEFEGTWDWNKVREIGMILTVDENGNDATMAEFDPDAIVQFGFIPQWTDGRGFPTHFGSGNFVDSSGNAQFPDHWQTAYEWLQAGIWEDHFIPSQAYQDSDLLGVPNPFASGNMGMAATHLWFTCCLGELNADWDIAAMPSWEGETTAKLHADTFRILETSENKDAAFEVLTYLVGEGADDLLAVYGGMPARVEETDAFFEGQAANYPDQDINWQVAIDSLNYPDTPSHESNMPNFNRADERIAAFYSLVQSDGTIDLEAEMDRLMDDLAVIYEGGEPVATEDDASAVLESDEEEAEEAEEAEESSEGYTGYTGEPTTVRWFVGLGTGQNAEQVEAQEAVVEAFNASQDLITLELEIVQNDVAYDTLATLIASGDAPDIVGPVGVRGSNAFSGSWLDLQPVIDQMNYDLGQFPEAAVDFYRVEGEGLIGLPFAVFPSHIYFNKDLFDEAGLPYPPQTYGEPYGEGTEYEGVWDWNKVREIGMILTVDENGNDATMAEFDPDAVVQFGFIPQWTDGRGFPTHFGSGNFVDDSDNAQFPDHWQTAYQWLYAGIWEDHFIPSQSYQDSDLLGVPNPFASGNMGMAATHLWFTCCLAELDAQWDIAAMPSWEGETTAKLHADTFRILNTTENEEAAFHVLQYLIGEASQDLLAVYGGMPARTEDTAAFFETQAANYPEQDIAWRVAVFSLNYPDNPSHEANMPNFNRADERIAAFYSLVQSDGTIDLAAEMDTLMEDLQTLFDEAE